MSRLSKIRTWWKTPAKKPWLHTKGDRVIYFVADQFVHQLTQKRINDLEKRVEALERKDALMTVEEMFSTAEKSGRDRINTRSRTR